MRDPVTCNVDGCMKVASFGAWCNLHSGLVRAVKYRRPKLPAGKFRTGHGYVMVWTEPRFPGSRPYGNGWAMLEHHKVMAEIIGRALFPSETVHFANGVRGDCRPGNLELRFQGKPIAEQVMWARQVIAWYGELFPVLGVG